MKPSALFRSFVHYGSLNMLGMLGLSCYILADTFFVSQGLGAGGLAALNLAIPVYSLIHGSGLMLGIGGATRYTLWHSQGRQAKAQAAYTHALSGAVVLAVLFTGAGAFFSRPLAALLGADAAVFAMTETYLRVLLLFAPAFLLNDVLLCFVRNDGAPRLAMAAMVGGSLSNILLDYLFMFPLGLGIFGAVLATGLAPLISLALLSPFFLKRRNSFRPARCRPSLRLGSALIRSGLPAFITEVSSGVVIIAFNRIILGLEGNVGVAAYGVVANLSLVVMALFTGLAQGAQPLLSQACGRGDGAAVGALRRWALLGVLGLSALFYGGVLGGAPGIAAWFNPQRDAALEAAAVRGLRLYFSGCAFAGINIVLSAYFPAVDRAAPGHWISLLRGFLLILPLAVICAALGGMTGLWLAFPLAEGLTALAGLRLLHKTSV